MSLTVPEDLTLVLPLSNWIGEGYTRASLTPDDDPGQPPKSYFTGQRVSLTIDGKTVLDSARGGLDCAYFDAVYFTAPIPYDPPQFRYTTDAGVDVYASAALWIKGLAVNLSDLPRGRHVVHLLVDSLAGYGYDNTWTITVRGH